MEKETDGHVSVEHANNTLTQSDLQTDVTFCDDDLCEEAKAQFGFHTEILWAFRMTARIVLANNRLTPIGRHFFCICIEQNYKNCKDVLNYVATHPEVQTTAHSMPPLFVLCGPGRTGSTLLYNLLACDPASRAPSLLDMTHPVPPIARSDTAAQAKRDIIARTPNEKWKDIDLTEYYRERNASHPSLTYEEDVYILRQASLKIYKIEPYDSTELLTWLYNDTNKDFAYEYHKIFIQMLNSVDAPQSHWVLKTSYHALYLDTLLRHYPSVSLIMTHRRLDEMVPSMIRVGLLFMSFEFDSSRHDAAIDRQMAVKRCLQSADVLIDSIIKFRRAHPHAPVFDVFYDDLVAKPIDTVRRIYNHFGLTWSEEFEQAMLMWLRDNPQGKQGRNTYTLEEYGLTHDIIEKRYEDYNRMFFDPRESLKTDADTTKTMNFTPDNIDIVTNDIQ